MSAHTQCLLPFVFLLFFLFLHPTATLAYLDPTETDTADFIRTNCGTTLYPDLCYTSLCRYASAIQQSPGQLARVAIGVTLLKARHIAKYISNLTRVDVYGLDSRAVSALHDCFSNLGDAVDEIRGSLKQMRQLGAVGSGVVSFRFQMSNVQTWMSAALTDEETCTDGFQNVPDGAVKNGLCEGVTDLKKFTSNALALVNTYVANSGIP